MSDTPKISQHYCSEYDLQTMIGIQTLAELTNDAANSLDTNSEAIENIITQADAIIDSKAGQVYTVPMFKTVSGTIIVSGNAATGTDTAFTTEVHPGDVLLDSSGNRVIVRRVISDTNAQVTNTLETDDTWSTDTTVKCIPAVVRELSLNLSAYFCFARRFTITDIPKYWLDMKKMADARLEDLSNELLKVPLNVSSAESAITAPTSSPEVDFYDSNNAFSDF